MEEDQAIEDNEDEDEDEDVFIKVEGEEEGGHADVATRDDGQEEEEDEDLPDIPVTKPVPFPVGSFVAAVYERHWYISQVEGEEPENDCDGFILLKYMQRIGNNQFIWGRVPDLLKTIHFDILLKTDPPIPVSNRYWGFP